ncbi:MAG: hypothetical protein JW775_03035 [Candidatus Aminicenantes bacterium]|nr:hypothetical protein [Candidatus Aminicenantes bacterium]
MNVKSAAIAVAAALVLACALPVSGQVNYGGYLAFEYIKGQAESPYPHGNFENLLAGFLAAGAIGQKFGFTAEVAAHGVDTFALNQAWAAFAPSETFTVRAGLYLVPFGAWNTASRPHETVLVRAPLNLEYLYPPNWRDVGLLVEGRIGVLTYAGYLGNGLAEGEEEIFAQQFRDNNTHKSLGGRIGILAGQAIRAGVSYYTGKYDDQDMRDLTLEGADLSWVTPQWEIHGEYTKALIENPQPFERGESEGWFIWACMSFKSFQPVGSYQKFELTDGYHGGGLTIDRSRWTAGVRVVLGPSLFIKAEYDWNKEKLTALKDNQWQVQVGLSF